MDGVLIINKPSGMTSHDVVARVRRILDERSIGHLGTLDPTAKGVLPLVVGRFTRLAAFYTEADKRYEGVMPPMGGSPLSKEDLAAVSAYVWAISHKDAR